MKPTLLIIAGIILSLLLGLWIYLYFADDTKKQELFNALNFGDTTGEDLGFDDFLAEDEASEILSDLRQLSLRRTIAQLPIAATASTSASVYLAEAGTGHIYVIDPASGAENRISNITVATARVAAFSPDGKFAAVSPDSGDSLTIITLPEASTTLDSFIIDASPKDFSITGSSTLLYTEPQGSSLVGYAYDIERKERSVIFIAPFREATVVWGSNPAGPHFVYPRTTASLEGYLYMIKNGFWSRLPASGYGLSATGNNNFVVYTTLFVDTYRTSVMDLDSNTSSNLNFSFLPEKCAFYESGLLCGLSNTAYNSESPDSWYSGEVSYSDDLWYTDFNTGESSFVTGLETESGRPLDVVKPAIASDGSAAYFINKTDQSLWIYEGDFISNVSDT